MASRNRSGLFSRAPPAAATLTMQVASVSLKGKAALHAKVLVEVDMPGKEDDLTRSAAAPVKLGEAKVNLAAKYDVGQYDSPVRAALVAALQTEEEEDSEKRAKVEATPAAAPATTTTAHGDTTMQRSGGDDGSRSGGA